MEEEEEKGKGKGSGPQWSSIGLPGNAFIKAPVFESVTRMISIKCSYVGNRQDTAEALDFFERGLIKAPYKVVGLSELQKGYEMMEKGQVVGRDMGEKCDFDESSLSMILYSFLHR